MNYYQKYFCCNNNINTNIVIYIDNNLHLLIMRLFVLNVFLDIFIIS